MENVEGVPGPDRNAAMVRMRQAMTREGYTSATLAAELGVSSKTVRRWLQTSNSAAPNIRQMYRFCRILDLNPTYLLYGIGTPKLSTVEKFKNFSAVSAEMREFMERIEKAAKDLESDTNSTL